jgi:EAL domain-containing protein (putative c-di-GMP-specific phosphodiesterase class I)/sensor domain CHASE-containing protein
MRWIAFLLLWVAAAPAANSAHDTIETRPAAQALDGLRHAWFGQLDELTGIARSLAVANDTYEFVLRPNIPYVNAHYTPKLLAADKIDTVLIVDRNAKPLFWRRFNHGRNGGFSDARAFLAGLPPLPPPGVAGVASFAGVATLAQGPALVAAMPIYATTGSGAARGWLIAARALDAIQSHRLEEGAHIQVQLLDPAASTPGGDIEAALHQPLTPIVRLDATHIHGVMAVMDVRGKPFRVFSVLLARQSGGVGPRPPLSPGRSTLSLVLAVLIGCIAIVTLGVLHIRRSRSARVRIVANPTGATPVPVRPDPVRPDGGVPPEIEVTHFYPEVTHLSPRELAVAPACTGFNAVQARERLHTRLAAINAGIRYQPQIDLATGRVSGVEALLCTSGSGEVRPALKFVAEIEATGLGLALLEHLLQQACRDQRIWLRSVGHDFPVGIPVSQRTLANRGFLPLVRRILMENELAPEFLELEVPEAALGASAATLGALKEAHAAGISIAIEGFDGTKSNLRLLTLVPIAKLRLDPSLVRNIGGGAPEALLFDGITGAARGLGIVVCVTGVASADLLAAILRHGRPLAQGMALGAPVDGEKFLQLLRGSCVDTTSVRPLELDDAGDAAHAKRLTST